MVIGRLLRPRFISVLLDITYSKSNIYLMSVLDTMLGVDIDYLESSQQPFSVDIIFN